MGYVNAMIELAEQNPSIDWIVFPSSSGGTQAGMLVGAKMSGFKGNILGISVDESALSLKENVSKLASKTAAELGKDWTFSPEDVLVNDDYTGKGYAVMGDAEIEAIQLFARQEALLLDPVYTGRAAAGPPPAGPTARECDARACRPRCAGEPPRPIARATVRIAPRSPPLQLL